MGLLEILLIVFLILILIGGFAINHLIFLVLIVLLAVYLLRR